MSWIGALAIVVAVYLVTNLMVRRFGWFSSTLSAESLLKLISRHDRSVVVVDLRTETEYREGHIPTAVNLPDDRIDAAPLAKAKAATVVLYSQTGSRSAATKRRLQRLGFPNVVNFGALRRWNGALVEGNEPGQLDAISDSSDGHGGE